MKAIIQVLYKKVSPQNIILALILCLSIALRINKITVWKIYSDSYKLLLIAKAFYQRESIFSIYKAIDWPIESYIAPYKWTYGFLIGALVKLESIFNTPDNNSYEFWAHTIVILSTILVGFLVFGIVSELTKSKALSLVAFCLLMLSGSSIIWGGFIVSDFTGIMFLLLFIYLDIKSANNLFRALTFLMAGASRPEFYIIGLVYYSSKTAFKLMSAKKLINHIRILILSAHILLLLSAYIHTNIFTENMLGDITIFILAPTSVVLALLFNKTINLIEMILPLIVIQASMIIIYWNFNPDISRYIVLIMPLEIITTIVLLYRYQKIVPIKYFIIAIILFLIPQMLYTASFPKYLFPDYHSELATLTLEYAIENNYTKIYIAQPDAISYANQYDIEIINLKELNNNKISSDSLIVKDHSLQYKGLTWNAENLELVKKFKTRASFWTNGDIKRGEVEFWEGSNSP